VIGRTVVRDQSLGCEILFVIASKGRIEFGFAEPDFTIRADPEEILTALDRLACPFLSDYCPLRAF